MAPVRGMFESASEHLVHKVDAGRNSAGIYYFFLSKQVSSHQQTSDYQ